MFRRHLMENRTRSSLANSSPRIDCEAKLTCWRIRIRIGFESSNPRIKCVLGVLWVFEGLLGTRVGAERSCRFLGIGCSRVWSRACAIVSRVCEWSGPEWEGGIRSGRSCRLDRACWAGSFGGRSDFGLGETWNGINKNYWSRCWNLNSKFFKKMFKI